ncbi:MAG: hypothetical protein PHW52_01010 [Candidatus Pacebacteria bacterium]|nr:hypothetical protein [Candidatus Paceibacterota bacterium]
MYKRKVLDNVGKSFDKGVMITTGKSIYAAVFRNGKILLRFRKETGSLMNEDLSHKWELVGGVIGLDELGELREGSAYQVPYIDALGRHLFDKAGLQLDFNLNDGMQIVVIPALYAKNDLIDEAMVCPLNWSDVRVNGFEDLEGSNNVGFFDFDEVQTLDIVSNRMKFMIEQAFLFRKRVSGL